MVSGTGAVAVAIREHTIERSADGHGWLLGDFGSGFWIGRQAVQAMLTTIARQGTLCELHLQVLRDLDVPPETQDLTNATIEAAHRLPPAELARLAPRVLAAQPSRCIQWACRRTTTIWTEWRGHGGGKP